jgi:hypothetical protein
MQIIKPNTNKQVIESNTSIFLAGSIEMGSAENWQEKIESILNNHKITILNPRRDYWDSSWKQEQTNVQFNNQVNWELNMLNNSTIIFMYLSPETKSPISLMELGLYAQSGKMIVCCPNGFWRKGNVDIVCTRYNIPLFNDFYEAVGALITKINLES